MRFGCCGSMIAPVSDPIGIQTVDHLARFGFDYVELSLAGMMDLPAPAFADLKHRLASVGLPCEACNNFFPARVRLTGSEACLPAALKYATAAMDRAADLSVQIIVFGSSGAKNVPPGFPIPDAFKQLVELLHHLGPLAHARGITIAIEPLNRLEANIINRASEGLTLLREVDHPHIQLLIDYYHLMLEHEDPDVLLTAGPAVRHLHLARIEGRAFPLQTDNAMRQFFRIVRRAGYVGRCSIEAYTQDFLAEAPRALRALKEAAHAT